MPTKTAINGNWVGRFGQGVSGENLDRVSALISAKMEWQASNSLVWCDQWGVCSIDLNDWVSFLLSNFVMRKEEFKQQKY